MNRKKIRLMGRIFTLTYRENATSSNDAANRDGWVFMQGRAGGR